ncbi:MAG TPA: helix-turn-helix domain-containing protein [Marinagarivorans sp.]
MLESLLALSCGYTVIASLAFWLAYFWAYRFDEHGLDAKVGISMLLGGIITSQSLQFWAYLNPTADFAITLFDNTLYSLVLLVSAAGFGLFSRALLSVKKGLNGLLAAQALVIAVNPWIENRYTIPAGFLIGIAYAVYFTAFIWRVRQRQKRHRLELSAYVAFAVMALVLGAAAIANPHWLTSLYTLLVALSVFTMHLAVMKYPYFVTDTEEAARTSYATSTLSGVDCPALLERLHLLMDTQQAYLDSGTTLAQIASSLSVTTHQLSELINSQLGMGFSQYLRRLRVEEAKRLLLAEPKASILSIGLSVGFASQSNFYTAFKELEGSSPGQYRKHHRH